MAAPPSLDERASDDDAERLPGEPRGKPRSDERANPGVAGRRRHAGEAAALSPSKWTGLSGELSKTVGSRPSKSTKLWQNVLGLGRYARSGRRVADADDRLAGVAAGDRGGNIFAGVPEERQKGVGADADEDHGKHADGPEQDAHAPRLGGLLPA